MGLKFLISCLQCELIKIGPASNTGFSLEVTDLQDHHLPMKY